MLQFSLTSHTWVKTHLLVSWPVSSVHTNLSSASKNKTLMTTDCTCWNQTISLGCPSQLSGEFTKMTHRCVESLCIRLGLGSLRSNLHCPPPKKKTGSGQWLSQTSTNINAIWSNYSCNITWYFTIKIIHTAEYQLQLLPWQPAHSCRPMSVLLQRVCPSGTCHHRVFAPGYTWFHFSQPLAT